MLDDRVLQQDRGVLLEVLPQEELRERELPERRRLQDLPARHAGNGRSRGPEQLGLRRKVYIGDEDGEVSVFKHSADPSEAMKEEDGEMVPFYATNIMGASVYSTPVVAGNVMYISNQTHLFAITPDGK